MALAVLYVPHSAIIEFRGQGSGCQVPGVGCRDLPEHSQNVAWTVSGFGCRESGAAYHWSALYLRTRVRGTG